MNKRQILNLLMALSASQSLLTQQAFAQISDTQKIDDKNEVERVEVIGSRIKKIAKEGASAVKNVSQETMANSANSSASDSLRDSTLATYGVSREQSGSSAAATTTIGLRGLGDTRTLVLLNGHRLPKDPSAEAVDLNLVPQIAIERIEVLKDGASALYGSDALGGVINIVTKKNFTGTEVSSKISGAEKPGGTTYDVSLLNGQQFDQSDLTFVLSYNHTDKILGKDREATKDGLSSIGSTGAWKDSGTNWTVQPGCSSDLQMPSTSGTGSRCYFRYNELASTRPSITQLSLLTDYNLRLDSGLKFYNRNIFVMKDIAWNYAPAPAQFSTPSGTNSEPSARTVAYRFMEAGNRDNQDAEKNLSTLVGLKGNFNSIWDYDVSAGYSRIHREDKGVGGYLNSTVLKSLIQNGTFDPLASPGSRGNLSSALTSVYQTSETNLSTIDAVATGELGEIDGEAIGVATGVSLMNERLTQKTDDLSASGEVIGSAGSNDSGRRDVMSGFLEASLPVTKKFEISLAGRVDKYSDFGTTFNPKISGKYKITDNYLVRGSIGTGFKAPTLSQLYGTSSDGYMTFIDRKLCATNPAACTADQYHVIGGGNKDLKEEKALTASVGTVMQPTSRFSLSIDGWYTKVSNLVGIDFEDLTQAELKGINPAQYGVKVERDNTGAIDTITAPNLNLQEEEISGIDVNAEVLLVRQLWAHELSLENDFSYIIYDKLEGFPGAGQRDTVGEWQKPHWRNVMSLALKNDATSYRVSMRSIPGQNVQDRTVNRKVSDLNEFDLSASYKVSAKIEIAGGIKNILNTKQPMDVGGGTGGSNVVSNDLYDINGRKIFVAYNQKF